MAVAERNVRVLEDLIDWPRVRAGLKEDIKATMPNAFAGDETGFALLGRYAGTAMLDSFIDAEVTAVGLFRPRADREAWGRVVSEATTKGDFISPMRFEVEAGLPTGAKITAILELDWLVWKVTRVRLPFEEAPEGYLRRFKKPRE